MAPGGCRNQPGLFARPKELNAPLGEKAAESVMLAPRDSRLGRRDAKLGYGP